MVDLGHRTNISAHTVLGKPLILYEDHRTILVVLWHAMKQVKALQAPPLLVYFDAHDDAKPPLQSAITTLKAWGSKQPAEREFHSFVEWDLSALDDDWLIAGMELDLIGDAINIGAVTQPNLQGFETEHVDHRGKKHRIWHLHSLWGALSYQGLLADRWKKGEAGGLWETLGWSPEEGFDSAVSEPRIVLDLDLDCFSSPIAERAFAWPSELIAARFRCVPESTTGRPFSAAAFLRELEDRVAFRTVARESGCCGGTLESQKILMALDDVLWDGGLFSLE